MTQADQLMPRDEDMPEWASSDDLWKGYEKWLDERNENDRDYRNLERHS